MASDRQLTVDLEINLNTQYRRTDKPESPSSVKQDGLTDDLSYRDLNSVRLDNGSGQSRADLMHHSQRTLDNSTEIIDINGGLKNEWDDTLNFHAVKCLVIYNISTSEGYLTVTFKDEKYYIGPDSGRIIFEPDTGGIEAIVSSTSSEEGPLTFSAGDEVTFDLFVIGSSLESSSSGA